MGELPSGLVGLLCRDSAARARLPTGEAWLGGSSAETTKTRKTTTVDPNNLEILGLNKKASKPEIKKAFAKLAQEFHPDKNSAPEAKEKFKDITE